MSITQQTHSKAWSLSVVEYYSSMKKTGAHYNIGYENLSSHENMPRQKKKNSHIRPHSISFSLPALSGTGKSIEVEDRWVSPASGGRRELGRKAKGLEAGVQGCSGIRNGGW